jgi:tripartite-type tricarboxylate transporter receptor subunit TctC
MKKLIFGLFFLLTWNPDLRAQTPFYQGKSIKLVVGSPAGSNYDQYGRLIAPYLSKHIAGIPRLSSKT